MRALVAGSRDFTDRELLEMVLDDLFGTSVGTRQGDVLVQGFARGADRMAYDWAKSNFIPVH